MVSIGSKTQSRRLFCGAYELGSSYLERVVARSRPYRVRQVGLRTRYEIWYARRPDLRSWAPLDCQLLVAESDYEGFDRASSRYDVCRFELRGDAPRSACRAATGKTWGLCQAHSARIGGDPAALY